MGRYIIPLGIATLLSLITTVLLGMKVFKINPALNFKLHKIFGFITLILALLHGGLVIYLYNF